MSDTESTQSLHQLDGGVVLTNHNLTPEELMRAQQQIQQVTEMENFIDKYILEFMSPAVFAYSKEHEVSRTVFYETLALVFRRHLVSAIYRRTKDLDQAVKQHYVDALIESIKTQLKKFQEDDES